MKIDIQFKELEILVSNMEAIPIEWKSDAKTEKVKIDVGIIIPENGEEFKNIEDLKSSKEGLLIYKGQQVLLYIKAGYTGYRYTFHFYDCDTLKKKRKEGRIERYVATQRKDGIFLMDRIVFQTGHIIQKDGEEKLLACQNCLDWYNNYSKRDGKYHTKSNFSIKDFFARFESTPISEMPIYTDITAPPSGYTDDWQKVSYQRKERAGWKCEECGADHSKTKAGLETHHINSDKTDNRPSNLKVLCEYCHAEYHRT